MLGFGGVVGGYGMFGRGWCGVGGLDMIRCWGWELGVLAFLSMTNCNLYKWGDGERSRFVFLALGRGWLCPLCIVSGWAWCGLLQYGWVSVHALVGAVGL